jgi:hypothetical protein
MLLGSTQMRSTKKNAAAGKRTRWCRQMPNDSAKPVLDAEDLAAKIAYARRAIRCLALELPASVHRDVADIFRPLLEQLEVHSAEIAELRATIERVDDITLYGRWLRYEDLRDALNSPAKKETP